MRFNINETGCSARRELIAEAERVGYELRHGLARLPIRMAMLRKYGPSENPTAGISCDNPLSRERRCRLHHSLFGHRDELSDPVAEPPGITALNIDDTRPAEAAHEALTRRKTRDPAGGGFFDVIRRRRRPGDQVAVVDDVFLVRFEVYSVYSTEAVQDQGALAADF